MLRKDIIEYVEKELSRGIHIDFIKKALLEVGHDIMDVEEAIMHIHKKRGKKEHNAGKFLIPIVIILILVFLGLFLREKEIGEEATEVVESETDVNLDAEWFNKAMSEENEDLKLLNDAIIFDDVSICEQITNEDIKSQCLDVVPQKKENISESNVIEKSDSDFFNDAIIFNDVSICEQIDDAEMKEQCISQLSPVNESQEIPQEETKPKEDKDVKLFNDAIIFNDASICEQITNEDIKSQCKTTVG